MSYVAKKVWIEHGVKRTFKQDGCYTDSLPLQIALNKDIKYLLSLNFVVALFYGNSQISIL